MFVIVFIIHTLIFLEFWNKQITLCKAFTWRLIAFFFLFCFLSRTVYAPRVLLFTITIVLPVFRDFPSLDENQEFFLLLYQDIHWSTKNWLRRNEQWSSNVIFVLLLKYSSLENFKLYFVFIWRKLLLLTTSEDVNSFGHGNKTDNTAQML